MTQQNSQTGKTQEDIARAEEARILDQIRNADGKSAEFSHSMQIAQKLEKGELDLDREQRIQIRDVLKDANKMKKDPYKHFMAALAMGKFPNKGRLAMKFFDAIEEPDKEKNKEKKLPGEEDKKFPGEKEKDYAEKFLEDAAKAENPQISEGAEKDALEDLEKLRLEEQAERMAGEARGKEQTSGIREKVQSVSTVNEKELWQIDRPPEGLIENLEAIELKMFGLMEQSNKAYKKGQSTEKLDAEIDRMEFERDPLRKQYIGYLTKAGKRYEAVQKLASRAGMDMQEVSRLMIWSIEHGGSKGVKVDKKTGKAEKIKDSIQIKSIYFKQGKEDTAAEFTGELFVDFTNDKGEIETAGYTRFLKLVDALEMHKDIRTMEDLNKEVAKNTRYEEVKEGQVYKTQILKGLDEEGEKVYEEVEFTIEKIETSGETPVITLNHTVTKTPKQWLSLAIESEFYFDRIQKEFSPGEFAKLVKQHRYSREIEQEELQTVLDRMAKARREEEIAMNEAVAEALTGRPATEVSKKRLGSTFMAPLAVSGAVRLPRKGEVSFADFTDEEAGGIRIPDAKVSVKPNPKNPSENIIQISYALTPENVANRTGLSGIPKEVAQAIGANQEIEPRIVMRDFSPSEFLERAENGMISRGQPSASLELEDKMDVLGGKQANIPEEIPEEAPEQEIQKETDEKESTTEDKANKPYKEAVPFDEAYQTGLPLHGKGQSYVQKVWNNTRFLSLDDLWKFGKTCYDYYIRRFEQRQKNRYGLVGKELPFFGSEMQQISQAANNEQTSHFKEALEKKGVVTIRDRLRVTENKEEFKACIIVLVEKGMMRWDDVLFWKNANKFVKPGKEIPIPPTNNPYTHISKDDNRTGMDFIEGAIDSAWGDGYYGDWYAENKNHYNGNAKKYYEEGKELEGVDGGHAGRLEKILHAHKEGEWVDPMEYEGLILHSIEAGKGDIQDKIYYLVEGVAAENKKGETILSLDRMAHVNSEMLGRFPIMEYMCARVPRKGGKKVTRFTLADYQRWMHWFDDGYEKHGHRNCKPTQAVDDFMWEYAIPSEDTLNRINKVARSIENVDHDDMYAYIPPATEDVLTDICKTNVGSRKGVTIEGYANVFPGFSQYIRSLSQHEQKDKLAEAIKSYVRFEGIMTNKFERNVEASHDAYQRMGDKTLRGRTICSKESPLAFITQMNAMVKEIVAAYGGADGGEELSSILSDIQDLQVGDMSNPDEKKKQDRKNYAFHRFGKVLNMVVQSDKGAKMLEIVQNSNLAGMPYLDSKAKARNKAEIKDNLTLE
ncbi:hypothetical protein M0P48_03515 [Candidatus Gracilibacteria bacterium]|nr:hypothetical protein [Candidatus Gracilibacteria bacterium]